MGQITMKNNFKFTYLLLFLSLSIGCGAPDTQLTDDRGPKESIKDSPKIAVFGGGRIYTDKYDYKNEPNLFTFNMGSHAKPDYIADIIDTEADIGKLKDLHNSFDIVIFEYLPIEQKDRTTLFSNAYTLLKVGGKMLSANNFITDLGFSETVKKTWLESPKAPGVFFRASDPFDFAFDPAITSSSREERSKLALGSGSPYLLKSIKGFGNFKFYQGDTYKPLKTKHSFVFEATKINNDRFTQLR